jgi:hypothetical protein
MLDHMAAIGPYRHLMRCNMTLHLQPYRVPEFVNVTVVQVQSTGAHGNTRLVDL